MRKNNYLQSILLNFYEKTLFTYTRNKAKKIICPSSYVREQFHDASKNKISVISPGVDTEKFKPIRKTHNYQILFVGSLQKVEAYKGLSYLLESFSQISKQFPKARLKVVGDGSARRHYEKVALKLGISDYVTFSGIITGDELVSVYQHADVLVLPSLFESFGMVFIEAMACSLPVIGTRVGGIPDVISHNKNGLLVAPGDIPALTRAIADILSNPAKANEMGNNGYEKVKASYAWDKQVEKTHGVITSLIN